MSIRDAFIAYETNHNTNTLIAAARAAGVTAKERDIIKAAEVAAKSDNDKPVRLLPVVPGQPTLLEQRADQFVAAVASL
jgi:hypothetical protein